MNLIVLLLFLYTIYILLGVATTAYLIHEELGSPFTDCYKWTEYFFNTGLVLLLVFAMWPLIMYLHITKKP